MQQSPEVKKRIQQWLDGPYDEETKSQIRALEKTDPKTLLDCFYTHLSFGTAGLRGLLGVGTNRMNRYTVQLATQGLANYIFKQPKQTEPHAVFISFDSRHGSLLFAREAARVLAANDIQVYLTKELRPTFLVSFGCRFKKCIAGIMITASHNPAEYNGYKVYWSDGGQVVPPHDQGIMDEVVKITSIEHVKIAAFDNNPLITLVDEEIDTAYLNAISLLQHEPEENKRLGNGLKITYTSLHGTGITLMPKALKSWGFTTLYFVEEQIRPDGSFPTVKCPNPEYRETLTLGIARMQETHSDILIATDPDADRLGVAVRHNNAIRILTGNEIGILSVYFLCNVFKKANKLSKQSAFISTIVSSELMKTIAQECGSSFFEVLTGFKYIAEKIHNWEENKEPYTFIFGAEESYGYLLGSVVRDKDAISAGCLMCEIALFAKANKMTVIDILNQIYQTYGIFQEKQLSLVFKPGIEGAEQIAHLMEHLRSHLPKTLCGNEVKEIEDYKAGLRYDVASGKQEPLTLPKSNVLLFRFVNESKLIVRPSGTEPHLKLYAAVQEKNFSSLDEGMKKANQNLDTLLSQAEQELKKC